MSRRFPKNPQVPAVKLTAGPEYVISYGGPLWRIHSLEGLHPSAWNELRHYGPVSRFRWEPHPPPAQVHTNAAVMYAAAHCTTAFAEVFQVDHAITLTNDRALTAWLPTRPLRLLNLCSSDWALHHGASASLPHAAKNICRSWAKHIFEQLSWPERSTLDGLYTPSTKTGDPVIVLFPRAEGSLPARPAYSRTLNHEATVQMATAAADRLRWRLQQAP